jgi:hypothetical protein
MLNNTDLIGVIGTVLNLTGSPFVALLPFSALGWIIYACGSIIMVVYAIKRKDKNNKRDWPLFIQMAWFFAWNISAILARV